MFKFALISRTGTTSILAETGRVIRHGTCRGHRREWLLENYPGLTHEDILAAIAYGAEMSRERYVMPMSLDR